MQILECQLCGVELTDSNIPAPTQDCGGDCLRCMADSFDEDCRKAMYELGFEEYAPNA